METEPSVWARLYEFAWAFWPYWWALAAGGIFALEPMMESYLRQPQKIWLDSYWPKEARQRHFRWASIVAVLVASFLAFDDVSIKSKATHRADLDAVGKAIGERDEARRRGGASPAQQSTIERLSGDLVAARGTIDRQTQELESQRQALNLQRAEVEKLKTPKAARHLSEQQKQRMKEVFSPLAKEFPLIHISAPAMDGNAQEYAQDFANAFKDIEGINVPPVGMVFPKSNLSPGAEIQILVRDINKIPGIAQNFALAMNLSGFQVRGGKMESLEEDKFVLLIGPAE